MNTMNTRELVEKYKNSGVREIGEVVGIWEFHIQECPVKLKIKVVRVEPQGIYLGIANYGIKTPDQAYPYRSIRPCSSIQEALEDALRGFLFYWDPQKADEIEFELDKEW